MSVGEAILELVRAAQGADMRWDDPRDGEEMISAAVKSVDEAIEKEIQRRLAEPG